MKFENKFVLILVASVIIYAIFLFMSDFTIFLENISNFKIEYLPLILSLVTISWIPLFFKWHMLLKNSKLDVPIKKSLLVFLAGSAFEITPGQVGALMKSQILKTSSNIPRTKTIPVIMVEKVYDMISAICASIIGIIILELDPILIFVAIVSLTIIFFFMYYKPATEKFFNRLVKLKFFSKHIENISEFHKIVKEATSLKISILSITLGILYWFIIGAATYVILLSFDIDVLNYLQIVSIYTTSILLGAISFVPAGIGITEVSITGLFAINGINISTALMLSVMIRILTLWYSVIIGFVSLKFTGGVSLKNN
ncbi:MAG: flippase-like domain-containing protein [Candidatus Nitrosopelagicus sp.]|nr:flippase-like domain-containing protein [Candidatus Nitrosopelagicus sp.]